MSSSRSRSSSNAGAVGVDVPAVPACPRLGPCLGSCLGPLLLYWQYSRRPHRRREDRSVRLCRLETCCQRGSSPFGQASLGRGNLERDPKPARTVPGSCERSIPCGAPRRSSRYGFLAAARRSNEAAVHSNELVATQSVPISFSVDPVSFSVAPIFNKSRI